MKIMSVLRMCFVPFAAVLLLLGLSDISAASEQLKLSFYPESMALLPEEMTIGIVIVENNTKEPIKDMHISTFSEVGVKVTATAPNVQILPPNGSVPWTIQLTRQKTGFSEGDVFFRLDYKRITGQTNEDLIPGVVVGKLAVKERPVATVDLSSIANLHVDSNIDKLVEKRPGKMFVSVSNKSSGNITILEFRTQYPDFVSVDEIKLARPIVLRPYNTHVFSLTVALRNKVQPGKHYIFIEADIAWQQNGQSYEATLTHAKEFVATVLGESDIIQVFKIPSLLFLPGFLILTMFLWLWKFSPKTPDLMKASDPEFWMFSVLLSFITAGLYPAVTYLLGEQRNFIEAYGFKDIAYIWVFSLALATFAWALIALAISLIRRHKRQKILEITFFTKTSKSDTLRILARNKMGLILERGNVNGRILYKLQRAEKGQVEFWASPAIQITWNHNVKLDDSERLKLYDLLKNWNDFQSILALADLLDSIADTKATVSWKDGDGLQLVASDQWSADSANGNPLQSSIVTVSD